MIRTEIVLKVPGTPAPKGSMRCRRNPKHTLYEDNAATKPWRDLVTKAARNNIRQRADKGQPLDVELAFTFDRPKSVSRAFPAVRGSNDVDKLARTILDALQDAEVLVDDAQVVDLVTRKRYAVVEDVETYDDALPWPGVVIRINPI